MEVWIIIKYSFENGTSEVVSVYDNQYAAMYSIDLVYDGIQWTEYNSYNDHFWASNLINNKEFYIQKFEVILDEVPIVKN